MEIPKRSKYDSGRVAAPIEERFWPKVKKLDGEESCWEWTGNRQRSSSGKIWYGQFLMGSRRDGTNRSHNAHRVSWMLAHGEIPDGMWVLHKCDNPACVRPDHLFLGDHIENMRDKLRKGRAAKPPVKLTDAQIAEIKARYSRESGNGVILAREFGVTHTTIYQIIGGKTRTDDAKTRRRKI